MAGVISGVQWAANDANINGWWKKSVLSLSIGGGFSQSLNDAITAVVNQGISVVVAAGNDNQDASLFSPSSTAKAITVGATDSNDNRASFSNFGADLDLFAPGVDVRSSYIGDGDDYKSMSGTSMGMNILTV